MEASGYEGRIGRYGGALADALIRVAGVSRDAEVLDVGCGTGALTERLAMFVGAARVTAVNPSPACVETCAARVPGASIRVGWAEDLPFADHAFDAVLAQLVLGFVSDGELAAREMLTHHATRGAAIDDQANVHKHLTPAELGKRSGAVPA